MTIVFTVEICRDRFCLVIQTRTIEAILVGTWASPRNTYINMTVFLCLLSPIKN